MRIIYIRSPGPSVLSYSAETPSSVTTSFTYTGGSPAAAEAQLYDGDDDTPAADGSGFTAATKAEYDFGSGKTIRRVRTFTYYNGTGQEWDTTAAFDIEYSDNGSDWTQVTGANTTHTITSTSVGSVGAEDVTDIDANGSHRYWRIVTPSATGGDAWLGQLTFYSA